MASTVWKGYLTFGLVSIPVRLVKAARAERVSLRQLYRPKRTQTIEPPRLETPPPPPPRFPEIRMTAPPSVAARQMPASESEPEVRPVKRVFEAESALEAPLEVPPSDLVKGFEYERGRYAILEDEDIRSVAPQNSTEMQVVEFVHFNEIDPVY